MRHLVADDVDGRQRVEAVRIRRGRTARVGIDADIARAVRIEHAHRPGVPERVVVVVAERADDVHLGHQRGAEVVHAVAAEDVAVEVPGGGHAPVRIDRGGLAVDAGLAAVGVHHELVAVAPLVGGVLVEPVQRGGPREVVGVAFVGLGHRLQADHRHRVAVRAVDRVAVAVQQRVVQPRVPLRAAGAVHHHEAAVGALRGRQGHGSAVLAVAGAHHRDVGVDLQRRVVRRQRLQARIHAQESPGARIDHVLHVADAVDRVLREDLHLPGPHVGVGRRRADDAVGAVEAVLFGVCVPGELDVAAVPGGKHDQLGFRRIRAALQAQRLARDRHGLVLAQRGRAGRGGMLADAGGRHAHAPRGLGMHHRLRAPHAVALPRLRGMHDGGVARVDERGAGHEVAVDVGPRTGQGLRHAARVGRVQRLGHGGAGERQRESDGQRGGPQATRAGSDEMHGGCHGSGLWVGELEAPLARLLAGCLCTLSPSRREPAPPRRGGIPRARAGQTRSHAGLV